jgi:hypothetical protein
MEALLADLPAWGLLVLGVVWLAFQFVQRFLERVEKQRVEKVRREYRAGKTADGSSVPPTVARSPETTGKHDLRELWEEEREREHRLEILGNTRQHSEMMAKLVAAESRQTQLLDRLVEMQARQDRMIGQLAETQRSLVRHVLGERVPGATLHEIKPGGEG